MVGTVRIYVFGNWDDEEDSAALRVAEELEGKISGVEFVEVKPQEDLPFTDRGDVVVMDVVEGRCDVGVFELVGGGLKILNVKNEKLNMHIKNKTSKRRVKNAVSREREQERDRGMKRATGLFLAPRGSVHDWDLGWQLAYLKKLGKLGRVWVVGIPRGKKLDLDDVLDVIKKQLGDFRGDPSHDHN